MYPLIELVLGLAFAGSYLKLHASLSGFVPSTMFVLWLLGLVLMSILLIIDAKTMKLPYKFLFPLIGMASVHALLGILSSPDVMSTFLHMIASVAVGAGIFAFLFVVSRGKWIGDSDVLFGIVIGLYLGKPLDAWLAIILACLAGLLYSLLYSIINKKSIRRAKIPFGPFLIVGLYFAFLFGGQIIDWYITTVLFI